VSNTESNNGWFCCFQQYLQVIFYSSYVCLFISVLRFCRFKAGRWALLRLLCVFIYLGISEAGDILISVFLVAPGKRYHERICSGNQPDYADCLFLYNRNVQPEREFDCGDPLTWCGLPFRSSTSWWCFFGQFRYVAGGLRWSCPRSGKVAFTAAGTILNWRSRLLLRLINPGAAFAAAGKPLRMEVPINWSCHVKVLVQTLLDL